MLLITEHFGLFLNISFIVVLSLGDNNGCMSDTENVILKGHMLIYI